MRKLPIALAAAAAILSTAAVAQTKPATAPAMTPKTAGGSAKSATSPAMTRKTSMMTKSTPTMSKMPAMSKTPAMAPMPSMAKGTTGGRMVTTKTSTGKTVTYNCSLAGNATKKACK